MTKKKQKSETKNIDNTTNIEPGMEVEATKGDLGEEDVSKPKVTGVVQDQQGKVDKFTVQKGVIFRKTLEIPADRVQSIDQEDIADESTPGKVTVDVSKKETESLKATGVEELDSEQQHNLLEKVEQEVPTGEVLINTFVPHLDFSFVTISTAVALLGATISPYNMFWQVQGEKEEQRAGSTKQKMRGAALDIAIGVISGNLIAYFIIISTASTLFVHHQSITTAADAARSLEPLLGPFAKYLFAVGLIGAGLVAIPVLLASTSYAVAGTFNWPAGLSKKPWQNEGFYLILTGALLVSLVLALLRIDPIKLIFWANVLSGVLAPILVVYLIAIANNRKIMRKHRLGFITNIGLGMTAMVMFAAAILLFYGLATGH